MLLRSLSNWIVVCSFCTGAPLVREAAQPSCRRLHYFKRGHANSSHFLDVSGLWSGAATRSPRFPPNRVLSV